MEANARRREKLECPAVPPLEQKLANLTRQRPAIGPAPRSTVLDKLATFLPQLANENARLEQQMQERPAAEFDIEQIDEDDEDGPYIEMDLACGILELRDEAALRAAERAMDGQGDPFRMAGSSSSSDDDSDDESDEEDEDSEDDDDEAEEGSDMGAGSDGEGRGGDVGTAQGLRPMEAEAGTAGADGTGAAHAQAAGSGHQGRGGRGRAARAPGGGGLSGGRRKVAAKRSGMIEELS